MMIAKCKGCGYYPVRENEKGKKCPWCKSEAEELMDFEVYKKGLKKRIITIAAVTGALTTAMGFYAGNFVIHWALMIYAAFGTVGGIYFALKQEKASLAEIAAAVREERDNYYVLKKPDGFAVCDLHGIKESDIKKFPKKQREWKYKSKKLKELEQEQKDRIRQTTD